MNDRRDSTKCPNPHRISVTNLHKEETLTFSLALLKGEITLPTNDPTFCKNYLTLYNLTTKTATNWPILKSKFKCLVDLERGENRIVIKYCTSCKRIVLNYTPRDTDHFVTPVYIICRNHGGEFQAPSGCDNSITSACSRVVLGSKLIQCLIAEKLFENGFGRKTFQIEADVIEEIPYCVQFHSNLPVEEARKMDQEALWIYFGREIMKSKISSTKRKFLAFLSATWWEGGGVQAHAALGGGGLALFGTGCLHTWPTRVEDVFTCFLDPTPVDTSRIMDDSCFRGTYGGCFSTTLGSVCHELGHTFDLGHSRDGIMGRGFDNIDMVFLPLAHAHTDSIHFATVQLISRLKVECFVTSLSRFNSPLRKSGRNSSPNSAKISEDRSNNSSGIGGDRLTNITEIGDRSSPNSAEISEDRSNYSNGFRDGCSPNSSGISDDRSPENTDFNYNSSSESNGFINGSSGDKSLNNSEVGYRSSLNSAEISDDRSNNSSGFSDGCSPNSEVSGDRLSNSTEIGEITLNSLHDNTKLGDAIGDTLNSSMDTRISFPFDSSSMGTEIYGRTLSSNSHDDSSTPVIDDDNNPIIDDGYSTGNNNYESSPSRDITNINLNTFCNMSNNTNQASTNYLNNSYSSSNNAPDNNSNTSTFISDDLENLNENSNSYSKSTCVYNNNSNSTSTNTSNNLDTNTCNNLKTCVNYSNHPSNCRNSYHNSEANTPKEDNNCEARLSSSPSKISYHSNTSISTSIHLKTSINNPNQTSNLRNSNVNSPSKSNHTSKRRNSDNNNLNSQNNSPMKSNHTNRGRNYYFNSETSSNNNSISQNSSPMKSNLTSKGGNSTNSTPQSSSPRKSTTNLNSSCSNSTISTPQTSSPWKSTTNFNSSCSNSTISTPQSSSPWKSASSINPSSSNSTISTPQSSSPRKSTTNLNSSCSNSTTSTPQSSSPRKSTTNLYSSCCNSTSQSSSPWKSTSSITPSCSNSTSSPRKSTTNLNSSCSNSTTSTPRSNSPRKSVHSPNRPMASPSQLSSTNRSKRSNSKVLVVQQQIKNKDGDWLTGGVDDRTYWTASCATLLAYHKWFNCANHSQSRVELKFNAVRGLVTSSVGLRVVELRGVDSLVLHSWQFGQTRRPKTQLVVPKQISARALLIVIEDDHGNIIKQDLTTGNNNNC
ncbi:putative uncharacterized protein DDB_G0282133 [Nilaparvata lugens]|uniref:putative uncharacterized protein DDB_G0282133 n=1 Tax=Nilaparvata lugens TaxID=108931 RepID=UPI00193CB202|nr:putative uncharacterized protein DDB_G0282133 [Nilaparvata lugens]